MLIRVALASLILLAYLPAGAEVLKFARSDCRTGAICFYWWPKLPSLPGWHTDETANYAQGSNGANTLMAC